MGVHDVALAPDNTTFTAVALDGSMYLLDVLDGVKMPSVSHTLAPNFWSTAFGGRSDWLYGGTGDGKVHKYGSEQGALLETYDTRKPSNVMGLDVTKDECFVATGDDNGILTIFDADTKKISLQLDFRKTIRRLCFDPLGRHLLIACEDHTIKIVNMPHGVVEATTPKHAAAVVSVDASPDGKYFVSGSSDGTVKLWDVRFNRCQQTYGSEGALKLWDVAFNPRNDMVACVGKEKKSILHYCNIVES
ncbi:vegetative incompatibility protein HET-E-1-like [Scaptodrosophila lebanonensis]|uniref:Vegetative incompatibility protein HET-E-1-like n=1 Tax=Drosophila lebanonensis TaxID=7225 RepID=A0A6J2U3C8_DROLE|nr:vegetative incompatibility protein HET-E-1-like [Scaptodrosophila lebanonensis]